MPHRSRSFAVLHSECRTHWSCCGAVIRCIALQIFICPGALLKTQEDSVSLYSSPEPQPFSAESVESIQTAAHVSHVICADAVCAACVPAEKGLQISASVQVLCLDDEQRLCSVQRVLSLTFTGIEAGTCLRPSLSVRAQTVGERGLTLTVTAEGAVRARDAADAAPSVFGRADSTAGGHGRDAARAPISREKHGCGTLQRTAEAHGRQSAQRTTLPSDTAAVSDTMLLVPLRI